jgi:ribosomal protein L19
MRHPLLMLVEQKYLRTDIPDFRPGDTVRVTVRLSKEEVTTGDQQKDQQKKEGRKEREPVAVFEGVVLRRRGEGTNATFTHPQNRSRRRDGTHLLLAFAQHRSHRSRSARSGASGAALLPAGHVR